jgi:hypothetical protein
VAVLGHDALEAASPRRLEERDPFGLDVFAQPDARIRAEDVAKESPPLFQRLVEE